MPLYYKEGNPNKVFKHNMNPISNIMNNWISNSKTAWFSVCFVKLVLVANYFRAEVKITEEHIFIILQIESNIFKYHEEFNEKGK